MEEIEKCRICGSDGNVSFYHSETSARFVVKCSNESCRNNKMLINFADWQAIEIKNHPFRDEIIRLVRSGRAPIS